MPKLHLVSSACLAIAVTWTLPALAADMTKVKVATTFLGLWDTSQPTFCADRGEFAKAGLDVEVVSTRGGSENVQAVVAGGADIGFSPGTNSVLGAAMQGAAIKVISSEFIGQYDTYFYVQTDSPLKSIDDIVGKSVGFPRPGGAGEAILLGLKAERNIEFNAVATGGLSATFTMVMTNQIDVGWSVPPYQLDAVSDGKIRVLFTGDDVVSLRNITGRFIIASEKFLSENRAAATKFLEVLDKCIDWTYANPEAAAKMYADINKASLEDAKKGMAFYPRSSMAFGPVIGMDKVLEQAVKGKFIEEIPSQEKLDGIIDILYTTPK